MSTRSRSERESDERSREPAWSRLEPAAELRPYFLALAAEIRKWGSKYSSPLTIGVTSLIQGGGKTTVALNLSISLARTHNQKILLVDANFDHPSLSHGAEGKIGFTDFLIGDVELQQCIQRLDSQNLEVMLHGTLTSSRQSKLPVELLGTIVEDQMAEYDYVVFDLPTVGRLPMFQILQSQMNGMLLVVQGTRQEHEAISQLKNALSRSGSQLIGLVVNKVV